jgi:hypothetical protein
MLETEDWFDRGEFAVSKRCCGRIGDTDAITPTGSPVPNWEGAASAEVGKAAVSIPKISCHHRISIGTSILERD